MKQQKKGISLIVLIIVIIVMIILSGAIIVSLSNSGIIGKARNAVSKMDKAQIAQMAELIKGEYLADVATDKSITKSKQELKERLIAGFEVTKDANGDDIIEVNDKWAVRINADLDIEVVEITSALKASSLVALTYTTSNLEENGEVYLSDIDLSITRLMTQDEYVKLRMTEVANVSQDIKEDMFYEYFNSLFGQEEPFNNIDDIVIYDINNNWYSTEYTTIEECLADENVQAEWGTTKEALYYMLCIYNIGDIESENGEITAQQAIDAYYKYEQEYAYASEYNKYTKKLKLYVKNGGKETLIADLITLTDTPTVVTSSIPKNGTYEYILKTDKEVKIVSEILQVKNIAKTANKLTTEQASDVWITDGNGVITLYKGSETNVTVPIVIGNERITEVGDEAFKNNDTITNIVVSKGITKIGVEAFYHCINIETVILPDTVIDIDYSAFSGAKNLTEITLPKDLKEIPQYLFSGCTSLTNIVIPKGVTNIGGGAFSSTSISSIEIPKSVVNIGGGAFRGCTNLKSIEIPEGVTSIGYDTFYNCSALETIALPPTITSIGSSAFFYCTKLKSIEIPEGVTEISTSTFYHCEALTSITIPSTVTSIGDYAFYECKVLDNITIPEGVTSIQKQVFNGCRKLTNITIPSTVTSISTKAFYNCMSLESITFPGTLISVDAEAFYNCSKLTSIYFGTAIPDGQPWSAPNENLQISILE